MLLIHSTLSEPLGHRHMRAWVAASRIASVERGGRGRVERRERPQALCRAHGPLLRSVEPRVGNGVPRIIGEQKPLDRLCAYL